MATKKEQSSLLRKTDRNGLFTEELVNSSLKLSMYTILSVDFIKYYHRIQSQD